MMVMRPKLTRFLLAGFLGWFVLSCGKDERCLNPRNPNCDNYDPCYGKVQPSAAFLMEEGPAFPQVYFADSLFIGYGIRFRSTLTDPEVQHKWYVGAETFTGSTTPSRNFWNVPRPATISISHVISYDPDSRCFPADDGKDSIVQTFRLIATYNELQTYGTYRGALNGSQDTFEIRMDPVGINGSPVLFMDYREDRIINFHNLGDTVYSNGWTAPSTPSFGTPSLYNHNGVFRLSSDLMSGSLYVGVDRTFEIRYKMKYWFLNDSSQYVFKGRLIRP